MLFLQGIFVVEALRNLAGASYVTEYEDLDEMNLRKYQSRFASDGADSTGQRGCGLSSSSSGAAEGEKDDKDVSEAPIE